MYAVAPAYERSFDWRLDSQANQAAPLGMTGKFWCSFGTAEAVPFPTVLNPGAGSGLINSRTVRVLEFECEIQGDARVLLQPHALLSHPKTGTPNHHLVAICWHRSERIVPIGSSLESALKFRILAEKNDRGFRLGRSNVVADGPIKLRSKDRGS